MSDIFVFEIVEHIGTLKTSTNGWTKEINLVRWNNADAKYDIRDWNEDHSQMTRGITLHEDEAKVLSGLLKNRF